MLAVVSGSASPLTVGGYPVHRLVGDREKFRTGWVCSVPLPRRLQTQLPTMAGVGEVWDKRDPSPIGSGMVVGALGVGVCR